MLLYGIAGGYQPSVQASIPALVSQDHFMEANSIINTISSFASLIDPVLGGILYSVYGLKPVLLVCMICFFISAVMEIFIQIPFTKQVSNGSILNIVKTDFKESIRFVRKDKPAIGKVLLVICAINLFLFAMINVQMPYMITEVLNLRVAQANKLYSFAEGALAAGGLTGDILTVAMCAQRLGNVLYGFLFEICKGFEFIVILFAGLISLIIAISTKNIFKKLLSYRA